MKKEKILLLTDMPPCTNYTAGIVTKQLTDYLVEEKHSLFCFAIVGSGIEPTLDKNMQDLIDYKMVEKPDEKYCSSILKKIKYEIQIKIITRKVLDYIKQKNITKFWFIIQGETMIRIANSIKKELDIDYVVQIWDPLEWWMESNNYNEKRTKKVLNEYNTLLNQATHCITSSKAMTTAYKNQYKIPCTEIILSLSRFNEYKHYNKFRKTKDEFTIVMIGQIYAHEEILSFLEALDQMKWKHNGFKIRFVHYGYWNDDLISIKKYGNNVKLKDYLIQSELLTELTKADLFYCPYFFSSNETYKKISMLSFPSKLVTYLSFNIPVLLHAPSYASPTLFFKENDLDYTLETISIENIIIKIKKIINNSVDNDGNLYINNKKVFMENFTFDIQKKKFLNSLDINYKKNISNKSLEILQITNVDIHGSIFNGYDLNMFLNSETKHIARQLVIDKLSDEKTVSELYSSRRTRHIHNVLMGIESEVLSIGSLLSVSSPALLNNKIFKDSDVVHYHMVHNSKFSLVNFDELLNKKPSIITLHDPWFLTGRCVHPEECQNWKTGCVKCDFLDTMFPFKNDNCSSHWKIKKQIFENSNPHIIVSTKFMYDLVKTSPITKKIKNIHLIPFGIDINKFKARKNVDELKKKYNIAPDSIVLFCRAQKAFKGTEYIVEALKNMNIPNKITVITCSEKGLFSSISNKYIIKDFGNVSDTEMLIDLYSVCDMFLMPSIGESFGFMAVEAMACSKPVIIFDNTALPSVTFAPDVGYLVENKNSSELQKAIEQLINHPEERSMRGTKGRKMVERHYNLEKYNQSMLDLYEKVAKEEVVNYEKKNDNLDFTDKESKLLVSKLNYIIQKNFSHLLTENIFPKIKNYKHYGKIDYSTENNKNIIKHFNDKIYEASLNNLQRKRSRNYIKEMLYYTFVDASKLKILFKSVFPDGSRINDCAKKMYGLLRKSKSKIKKLFKLTKEQ